MQLGAATSEVLPYKSGVCLTPTSLCCSRLVKIPPMSRWMPVERDERVVLAAKDLPAEQIEAVLMRYFSKFSHSQISEQTGLPLGTVKSRIRLAFGRLRRALEGDVLVDTDF
ncbi:MAG: sigma factor-like helix-turn-helix DNA-binding protein [Ahrensia sp.]|nr:sigma factor-like helix-turn-helix DNA-binding protein [Ahrensia sp.]